MIISTDESHCKCHEAKILFYIISFTDENEMVKGHSIIIMGVFSLTAFHLFVCSNTSEKEEDIRFYDIM